MTAQIQFDQAVSLARQGRLPEAQRLLEYVVAMEPRNVAAHRMSALVCYQQGQHALALTAIESALAVTHPVAELFTLRGVIFHALGRADEAVANLTKATALDPGDVEAWYNRGVVLGELERFQDSIESYDRILALEPNVDALVNRADALLKLKRANEALASCDEALALQPSHALALCNRGLALAELDRPAEAVAMFDRALAQDPAMAETWNIRGRLLHDLKRYNDAVASFDKAIALDPGSMKVWSNRGQSLLSLQQFDAARASYEKAVAVAAPRTPLEWSIYGDALRGLNRYDAAIEAYDKALESMPDAAEIWSSRAVMLRALARFEEALQNADQALALRPALIEAQATRGRVLLETNRIEEGLKALARSGEGRASSGPTAAFKAQHDAEQRDYLAAQGIAARVHPTIVGDARLTGPVVNSANAEVAANAWAKSRPQIVVIDNLLTPEGLEALRRFCWGSTIWQHVHENGYLGAFPEHGFAAPLLAQIAEELRSTFPTIIGDHGLRLLWGFKYDSHLTGIAIHADQAAVNVNFWLTPDEANLNPERGGLVVYDVAAPADWDAADYNSNAPQIWEFLKRTGAKPLTVPYRANRAVIFDSDLFHKTDDCAFKDGYLNRRINCTMLFGRRTPHGA